MQVAKLRISHMKPIIAGAITSISGVAYETAAYHWSWTREERVLFFLPYALFGFFAPAVFLVIGREYLTAPVRSRTMSIRVGVRVLVWFVAAAVTVFACKAAFTAYGALGAP